MKDGPKAKALLKRYESCRSALGQLTRLRVGADRREDLAELIAFREAEDATARACHLLLNRYMNAD